MRPASITLALAAAGALIAAPLAAVEAVLTEEEAAACEAGGGCVLITQRNLRKFAEDAFAAGQQQKCGART